MSTTIIRFNTATDNYKEFIESIREWAIQPGRFSHGRPVLPRTPQNMHQYTYADLELRANDEDDDNVEFTVVVRIRRHDLYIIGYRMQGAQNYLEFKWKDGAQFIPNSTSLGFGENYTNLGKLENQSSVGYKPLNNAIITLASAPDTRTPLRKQSLRTMAIMVSETVRLEAISKKLIPLMEKKREDDFEVWMPNLINNWTTLSDMLLRKDQYGISFRLPKDQFGNPNKLSLDPNLEIKVAEDAAKHIAILKGNYHPPAFALNDISTIVGNGIQGKGQALVEIFSVRVTNITGRNPGDLYGCVELFDGLGTFPLYDLRRTESEPIRPNDNATLTGPYRAVSGSQIFQVSLDLKNKGSSPSSDEEVSKGSYGWDLCELTNNNYYDQRLTDVVDGKNGSVTVYYTPFCDALQARVEVVLVEGDDLNPVHVQGSLTSQYSNYDYSTDEERKYYRTSLFSKASEVNVGSIIPLSRSVVAVPTDGSLIIEANITSANNHEIAKGSAEFSPQLITGNTTKEIMGKNGCIRVTVTWFAQISE